jgi:hypothetical protein
MSTASAKAALLALLLGLGCLIAGVYGALHDQISYTVSPDYFHAFKFHQLSIPADQQNRVGAAIVGWRATWWMGAIIGVPILTAGLLLPGAWAYFRHCLVAFLVVTVTALIVGLGALAFAWATITPDSLPGFRYPEGVDRIAFARAGVMHNFSYLGGFLGILTGTAYLAIVRYRAGSPIKVDG